MQAVIPRATRKVAPLRKYNYDGDDDDDDIDDDDDNDDDDDHDDDHDDDTEVDGVMPVAGPPQPAHNSLVAGGKKAKLAVELKLNLEIEIELKVRIQGDLTLELF